MADILILSGSFTGNTDQATDIVCDVFRKKHISFDKIEMIDNKVPNFDNYKLCIIGGSTWFNGTPNPIVDQFFDLIKTENYKSMFAFFGCGDKLYPNFCTVIEFFIDKLKSPNQIIESLRIDGTITNKNKKIISKWTRLLITNYHKLN